VLISSRIKKSTESFDVDGFGSFDCAYFEFGAEFFDDLMLMEGVELFGAIFASHVFENHFSSRVDLGELGHIVYGVIHDNPVVVLGVVFGDLFLGVLLQFLTHNF
jgi:hypothetical protein